MTVEETIASYPVHNSIRGAFGFELFKAMAKDERIHLILPDLGYKIFDLHLQHFPDRARSIGASEQAAVGIAIGLALEGKIPFVYSITTFLMFRPFEWIRNYIHYEKIPVRLVGSGYGNDYKHDGITHQPSPSDMKCFQTVFPGIPITCPLDATEVASRVSQAIHHPCPSLMILRR